MRKVKTQQLKGRALDWVVAKIRGYRTVWTDGRLRPVFRLSCTVEPDWPAYSTDTAAGWGVVEREDISAVRLNDLYFLQGNEKGDYYEPLWAAFKTSGAGLKVNEMQAPDRLTAVLRCYVASKLGDEVEVPEELLT